MTDNRHKVCGNRKIANFFSIRTQIKFIKPSCNNLINGERAVFLNGSIDYLYGQKFLPELLAIETAVSQQRHLDF